MHRRAFLGALCAAPVAVPAVTKSLAKDVGGSTWAVRLNKKGYVVGVSQGERVTIIADQFRVSQPGEGPIQAFKLAGDQIVSNPEFPWGQFFGD